MVITDILNCKNNKNRVNVYADGEFLCSLYIETVLKNSIKKGCFFSHDDLVQFMKEDEEKYALDRALKYISYRMRSAKEIKEKLKKYNVSENCIDNVIKKMQELGYVNDRLYAETYFSELKQNFGKAVIQQKMYAKGINKEIVHELLSGLDQYALAVLWAEKLFARYKNEDKKNIKQKVFRALMARGFDFDEIRSAVEKTYQVFCEENGDD